ncbi:MAG: suppressor of fused domain protein [Streptosporangiaceae bacterium]
MPTLRRGGRDTGLAARPGRPDILLSSDSPYGSRRLVVEYDGSTTAAYVYDQSSVIAAVWIANHRPAPQVADPAQAAAGQAPVMPAGHTKHPAGLPQLDPRVLRALWFEEGDGVAVAEGGRLLAVIPGWSDVSRGMPGYSRECIGQTPFAWALDDALEGLGPRADRATEFWRWRASDGAWAGFQQALLGHLLGRLGPGSRYWDVSAGKMPQAGVSERPPTRDRPFTVLSTIGMSCQRMPVVEQFAEDASSARIELALATTMPSPDAARIFLWLAHYPWRAVTWFGPGHTIRWYHEPATFPLGGGNTAVLLLDDPAQLIGPEVPDMSGFSFGGDPVRWLWVLPISEPERLFAKERGSASLVTQLAAHRRSWVAAP